MSRESAPPTTEPVMLHVDAPTFGPAGVARRADGKVVLVHGAYPGDIVAAAITREHTGYAEAVIESIETPSVDRVQPPCSRHPLCGGCAWMGLSREAQSRHKRALVERTLRNLTGAPQLLADMAGTGPELGYRQRCRLALEAAPEAKPLLNILAPPSTRPLAGSGYTAAGGIEISERPCTLPGRRGSRAMGSLRMGFFRHGTHEIVPLDSCPVCMPELNEALGRLNGWPMDAGMEGSVELTRDSSGAVFGVFYLGKPCGDTQGLAKGLVESGVLAGCVVKAPKSPAAKAGRMEGHHLVLGLHTIPVTCESFSQANPWVNDLLVGHVVGLVSSISKAAVMPTGGLLAGTDAGSGPKTGSDKEFAVAAPLHIVELYAGHGNFTRPLLHLGHKVTAVELGVDLSLIEAHANLWFLRSDAAQAMKRLLKKGHRADLVMLDPPRSGAKEVMLLISAMGPKAVLYVSCDPNTFARDAALLQADGYRLASLRAFDMMPHTWHAELVALMTR